MLFNSFHYLLFFISVTVIYFNLPLHLSRWWLFFASCYFYMVFKPVYLLILFLLIGIDYFAALKIEACTDPVKKKRWLVVSLMSNLALLGSFKYLNFFLENAFLLAQFYQPTLHFDSLSILVPIGLSFHTFQSMAYTIEVYFGRQKAEQNLLTYSLYVLFFPQMVAGPIERPQHLIHQFIQKADFNSARVSSGLRLILWGYFKKAVVADRLSPVVDAVFSKPDASSGALLTCATVLFAVQIYGDFSGYSDMAIGSARVLGFNLRSNFDRPYAALSVSDFWRRWHISLSTWFRDYVYIPLGGSRSSKVKTTFCILFTFILSGFWHGASWNFIIWGALNGFYIIVSRLFPFSASSIKQEWIKQVLRPFQITLTFILISFSWIFFRSANISDALLIVSKLPTGWDHWIQLAEEFGFWGSLQQSMFPIVDLIPLQWKVLTALVLFLFSAEFLESRFFLIAKLDHCSRPRRWAGYYVFLFMVLVFAACEMPKTFIYFQF